MFVWESSLVGEGVDDLDSDLAASTVGPGGGDGVADAAVQQPAGAALVEALVPGSEQLAGGGQGGVELLAVLHCLLKGEAVVVTGEEDLTCTEEERKRKRVQRGWKTDTHRASQGIVGCFTFQTFHITEHIVKLCRWSQAVGSDPGEMGQVTGTVISGCHDGIPEHWETICNLPHINGTNKFLRIILVSYPSSPDALVAEPASITLVQTFLKGCLKLLRAGDDGSNVLTRLLSLHEGQSVAACDGPVVEDHTWEMGGG